MIWVTNILVTLQPFAIYHLCQWSTRTHVLVPVPSWLWNPTAFLLPFFSIWRCWPLLLNSPFFLTSSPNSSDCDFPYSFWNSCDKCPWERRSLTSTPAVPWAPSLTGVLMGVPGALHLVGCSSVYWSEFQAGPGHLPPFFPSPTSNSTCLKSVLPYPLSQNSSSQLPHLHWTPITGPVLLGLEGKQNLPLQTMSFGILF